MEKGKREREREKRKENHSDILTFLNHVKVIEEQERNVNRVT